MIVNAEIPNKELHISVFIFILAVSDRTITNRKINAHGATKSAFIRIDKKIPIIPTRVISRRFLLLVIKKYAKE